MGFPLRAKREGIPPKIENRRILYVSAFADMAGACEIGAYTFTRLCPGFSTYLSLLTPLFGALRGPQRASEGVRHSQFAIGIYDSRIFNLRGSGITDFGASCGGRLPPSHRPTRLTPASRSQAEGWEPVALPPLAAQRAPGAPIYTPDLSPPLSRA